MSNPLPRLAVVVVVVMAGVSVSEWMSFHCELELRGQAADFETTKQKEKKLSKTFKEEERISFRPNGQNTPTQSQQKSIAVQVDSNDSNSRWPWI